MAIKRFLVPLSIEVDTHTYPTIEAAQAEINEYFEDMADEIKDGPRKPDEAYDREDYKIYDTEKKEYVA